MDGYAARSRVSGIIRGLGFGEADAGRPLSSLSGGQKTRVFLGKLLLEQPDLILLDEPTNHLDLESIEWLESYLMNYPGAVLIVSHDRFFLDRVVNKIFDLSHGRVNTYEGNYTQFTEKKEALAEAAARAYENQQAEIKHQEAVIQKLRSFNREKSIKRAESREKLLDKVERLDNPYESKKDMGLFFTPDETQQGLRRQPTLFGPQFLLKARRACRNYGRKRYRQDHAAENHQRLASAGQRLRDAGHQGLLLLLRSGAPGAASGKNPL